MENYLIVTGAADIPVAENVARNLAHYRVLYFDPVLADLIRDSDLEHGELIVWDDAPDYPALVDAAHARAFGLERDLAESLRPLLPEHTADAWQHLNLYYFFLTFLWYSRLWRELGGRLADGRAHVFINDNPVNYYWPSFLPGLLLLEQLRSWGVPFSAFTYGARPDESDVVMDFPAAGPLTEHFDLLTHLPTCFYDVDYFNEELRACGKTNINIQPKYWSVALEATQRINLLRLGERRNLADLPAFDVVAQALTERIDALLVPYISTADFRARQAGQWSNLYQSQVTSLHLMERFFEPARPKKLLLSDHDAGFHGPLISFAVKHSIPVLMVPHSKTSLDLDFACRDVTILTHPMQGVHPLNSERKRCLHFSLPYAETFSSRSSMPRPLRRVGLLLNGLSLNGILCSDFGAYVRGIQKVDRWCKENQIDLAIRCRQGQALTEILGEAIGLERSRIEADLKGSLQTFVQSIDLCLMYDTPTNAGIEFLRVGVPILNPIPAPLSRSEAATVNQLIIPSASVDTILAQMDSFVADENSLQVFCLGQFADYMGLFKSAYALRRFL
jgi:hypothetical protein